MLWHFEERGLLCSCPFPLYFPESVFVQGDIMLGHFGDASIPESDRLSVIS